MSKLSSPNSPARPDAGPNSRPCLFLDRDGVIIKNVPYATDPDTVELMFGIGDLIRRARERGYLIVVVTNQSGIGRGWMTVQDYQNITDRMLELLQLEQALPDQIYFAPYFEKSVIPEFLQNAHWRKPGIGMIEQALKDFSIDLSRSMIVGDRSTDIEAGHQARVAQKYLLRSEEHLKERGLIAEAIDYQYIESLDQIQF